MTYESEEMPALRAWAHTSCLLIAFGSDQNHEETCKKVCRYSPMRYKILPYSPASSAFPNSYLYQFLGTSGIHMGDGLRRNGLRRLFAKKMPWFQSPGRESRREALFSWGLIPLLDPWSMVHPDQGQMDIL